MTFEQERALRELVCEIGRRMYARNFAVATDGNISVRLGPDRFLCTPSGTCKGDMQPDELLIADGQARKIAGDGKITSEFFTHLAAYEERPEVNAVVHGHPPKAIGLMLAGHSLAEPLLPEVVYALGTIPTAEYATPGTPEGAVSIRDLVRRHDAILLDRHGAVTVGRDLHDAYYKLEKVEHAAEAVLIAYTLGGPRRLTEEQRTRLESLGEVYNVVLRSSLGQ